MRPTRTSIYGLGDQQRSVGGNWSEVSEAQAKSRVVHEKL